jgi:hypothetical protein
VRTLSSLATMPKLIRVEKVETYLGTTYRFYVHSVYMGATPTRAQALEAAKEALGELGLQDDEEEATAEVLGGANDVSATPQHIIVEYVRFTSRHLGSRLECPLCAKSGPVSAQTGAHTIQGSLARLAIRRRGGRLPLGVRMILFDLGETQSRRSRPGSLPTLAVCAVLGLFAACVQRL